MQNLATWIRERDDKWFGPLFAARLGVRVWNARVEPAALEEMDGLLVTGGPDISPEFLRQPVPDPSVVESDAEPDRDAWEFAAVDHALGRGLPILAICKGLQVFNVALGGTLHLDIRGHDLPETKLGNIQPLRFDAAASLRFENVNSSHHQALDRVADGCAIEAWCSTDDVVEQIRLRDYPYALGVQYHPERHPMYAPLFDDFLARLNTR